MARATAGDSICPVDRQLPATTGIGDDTGISEAATAALPDLDTPMAVSVSPTPATPAASPDASPEGSPAATPIAVQPADPETAALLESIIRDVADCQTTGNFDAVSRMSTERYLGQLLAGDGKFPRAAYVAIAQSLPLVPITILSVQDSVIKGKKASVTVLALHGKELNLSRFTLVRGDAPKAASTPAAEATGEPEIVADDATVAPDAAATATPTVKVPRRGWLIDSETPMALEPPINATTIDVSITDRRIKIDPKTTTNGTIVLRGTNDGDDTHEMLVIKVDAGSSVDAILRAAGPAFPAGLTFIGQTTINPGDSADLILVDLTPGTYAIVDLLPDAEGVPHLVSGLYATFKLR